MTIGILSSIKYDHEMQTAFQQGFSSTAGALPTLITRDDLGFSPANIDPAIQYLNGQANMIVTFGGRAACNRMIASGQNHLPFVSLIGSNLNLTPGGLFKGYINLAAINMNMQRITWLANHVQGAAVGSAGHIGLFYNSTTSWGPTEATEFTDPSIPTTGASTVPISSTTLGNPTAAHFSSDFAHFPAGTKAIIVGASAFFHKHRDALIQAANSFGAYMCYPAMTYKNTQGTHQPTPGRSVILGVDLDGRYASVANSAYYLMGSILAAGVYNHGNYNGTPNPQTQIAPTITQPL
jgi:hypothetical protein